MIDSTTSSALDAIERSVSDMTGQYRAGYVPKLDEDRLQGSARTAPSLDPMHAVPPTDTYFVGVDALGRRSYSRDGALSIVDGKVTLPGGSIAMGYPQGSEGEPAPLALPSTDGTLNRAVGAHVEADGTIAYDRGVIDPKTQAKKTERVVVGRLALATFPPGTRIAAADGVHATVPAGVESRLGRPGQDGFGKIVPRADDRGGVDLQRGISHLREAYLAFSVLQSAHGARGKTDKTVMSLLK